MKKLPIGIQTFSDIINEDFVYVDKTSIAYNLITKGRYYFLSRPRRFGKSLFLDTLKEILEGNKKLFKGLYIYDKWEWDVKYPVLKISLGSGVIRDVEKLDDRLRWILEKTERGVDIKCPMQDPIKCFEYLVIKSYEKYGQKVVILIDEYDKPILDNITDSEVAKKMRDKMKNFYSIIKDNDDYIRFVFITGVSKFSKMNLFSGLNNLEDITIDKRYATICGYTHNDLLTVFKAHLEGADMDKVKEWYNGYNYLGDKVYNPFDILLFISKGFEYRNYWWSTGNPSFLMDLLYSKDYSIPQVENYVATEEALDSFDVDTIALEVLLWQTGYLTIVDRFTVRNRIKYKLGIPNLEIQFSLNDFFIDALTQQKFEKIILQDKLYDALVKKEPEALKKSIVSLFANIPYQYFTKNPIYKYEGYYASVMYAYFASLGFEIIPEDATNRGRIDLTLKTDDAIYIIEFKVTGGEYSGTALQQIKKKKYYEKYINEKKEIYLVGIEFDRKKRNIDGFEWEKI